MESSSFTRRHRAAEIPRDLHVRTDVIPISESQKLKPSYSESGGKRIGRWKKPDTTKELAVSMYLVHVKC